MTKLMCDVGRWGLGYKVIKIVLYYKLVKVAINYSFFLYILNVVRHNT